MLKPQQTSNAFFGEPAESRLSIILTLDRATTEATIRPIKAIHTCECKYTGLAGPARSWLSGALQKLRSAHLFVYLFLLEHIEGMLTVKSEITGVIGAVDQ